MTNITTHGNEAIVSSMVLDYLEFNNTLNNVKKFMNKLPINGNGLESNPQTYSEKPENRAMFNILISSDFEGFGLSQLEDFAQLIKVVGLDDYDNYTISEYAYMYTNLVEYRIFWRILRTLTKKE